MNNSLPMYRFGFRKVFGASDALLILTHDPQSNLDYLSETRIVTIDFRSAFDIVNHKSAI